MASLYTFSKAFNGFHFLLCASLALEKKTHKKVVFMSQQLRTINFSYCPCEMCSLVRCLD